MRKELTQLKKTEDFKWLNEYSNNVTKQAVKDGCEAYKKFFKKLSDKPKFKSRRKSKTAFYQDTAKTKFTETHVRLEKIGWVKLSEKSRVPVGNKITNPRVTHDGLHWHISVGIEVPNEEVELTEKSIGIDLGLKDLAIISGIDKPYKNINKSKKVKKLEKRLRRLQRKVSRKYLKNKKGGSYCKTSNSIVTGKQIGRAHV